MTLHEVLMGPLGLDGAALGGLFLHFAMLSLLAVGGAITTTPDMQRYLVADKHWLTDAQFSASVALAQAAPGPNVLFVAVMGWSVGGLAGVAATLGGSLLPSTTLALAASRWGERHREARALRAFTAGLAPITLGLLLATGWVLAEPYLRQPQQRWGAAALIGLTLVMMLRTRIQPIWLVAAGALVGAAGGL